MVVVVESTAPRLGLCGGRRTSRARSESAMAFSFFLTGNVWFIWRKIVYNVKGKVVLVVVHLGGKDLIFGPRHHDLATVLLICLFKFS